MRHYAESNALLPMQQASSRHGQGAEHHVFALSSFLRARRRAGLSTYVAYIDFAKAFDRVSPAALEAVLRRMGVPDDLLRLLRVWRMNRQGSMVVNGVSTDPFPLLSGVPQGCPLSPLLFNLYLASLSRYLDADPDGAGAEILGVKLGNLVFADDVAIVGDRVAAMQRALDRVHTWSVAWGMQVSVGPSKTEAQAFMAPGDASATHELPPLFIGGTPVRWVEEYRYLGYALRSDLDDSASLRRIVANARAAYSRLFHRNATVRTMPTGVQLQIFKGYVVAAAEYLRGVIDPCGKMAAELDLLSLDAARGILRMPAAASKELVWAISGLEPAAVLAARARTRFVVQLSSANFVSPATLMFRALVIEPVTATTRTWGPLANLVHIVLHLLKRDRARSLAWLPETGYPAPRAKLYARQLAFNSHQVALAAASNREQRRAASAAAEAAAAAAVETSRPLTRSRSTALATEPPPAPTRLLTPAESLLDPMGRQFRDAVAARAAELALTAAEPTAVATARGARHTPYAPPTSPGSLKHAIFLFRLPRGVGNADLGSNSQSNSLAYMGSGLASVINSDTKSTRARVSLLRALLGAECMRLYPWAEGGARVDDDGHVRRRRTRASDRPPPGPHDTDYADRFKPWRCPLCNAGFASVHHAALECQYPDLLTERATTLAETRKRIGAVTGDILASRGRLEDLIPLQRPPFATLRRFIDGAAIGADETAFIVYRILLAVPFPAARANAHGFSVAAMLGTVLELGDARSLRRTCQEWGDWSERRLDAIAGAWKAAMRREAPHAARA